jgi:uncharacterized membrane protein YdjX (TVP38/TMEM64 family)
MRAGQPPQHWRSPLGLLLVGVLVVLLLSSDSLHARLQQVLSAAEPVIRAHPLWGGALFVLLAALSAMLAFFSSALLVPAAVYSWGPVGTILLLWLGWLLGGMVAYGLGRSFGRPLVRSLSSRRLSEFYLERLPAQVDLPIALLVQLALPSELPGYLCGVLRVRFATYVAALALVEAPFAVGAVLLGESLLQRESGWLVVLLVLAASASVLAAALLHRRLRRQEASSR